MTLFQITPSVENDTIQLENIPTFIDIAGEADLEPILEGMHTTIQDYVHACGTKLTSGETILYSVGPWTIVTAFSASADGQRFKVSFKYMT